MVCSSVSRTSGGGEGVKYCVCSLSDLVKGEVIDALLLSCVELFVYKSISINKHMQTMMFLFTRPIENRDDCA